MFKGLITKAVKDMVVDPIMNPTVPSRERDDAEAREDADSAPARPKSEFDPDAFDRPVGGGFNPDSFDAKPGTRATSKPVASAGIADPDAARRLMHEAWDIDLPFFPGEGTACGLQCQCAWQIERRHSADVGADAIFATWVAAGSCETCQDCLNRADEWADVLIRPAFD